MGNICNMGDPVKLSGNFTVEDEDGTEQGKIALYSKWDLCYND